MRGLKKLLRTVFFFEVHFFSGRRWFSRVTNDASSLVVQEGSCDNSRREAGEGQTAQAVACTYLLDCFGLCVPDPSHFGALFGRVSVNDRYEPHLSKENCYTCHLRSFGDVSVAASGNLPYSLSQKEFEVTVQLILPGCAGGFWEVPDFLRIFFSNLSAWSE